MSVWPKQRVVRMVFFRLQCWSVLSTSALKVHCCHEHRHLELKLQPEASKCYFMYLLRWFKYFREMFIKGSLWSRGSMDSAGQQEPESESNPPVPQHMARHMVCAFPLCVMGCHCCQLQQVTAALWKSLKRLFWQ